MFERVDIRDVLRRPLAMERVQRIVPIKLYYLCYGRNAWHTTWVKKYTPDAFSPTLFGAMQIAEDLRVNGSVFYIQEIAALCLRTQKYFFIICHINAIHPFAGFDERNCRPNFDAGTSGFILRRGMLLSDFAMKFIPSSASWTGCHPDEHNGVIFEACERNSFRFEPLVKVRQVFYRQRSLSTGARYYLSWDIEGRSTNACCAAVRLANRINRRVMLQNKRC